jgi:hypothetical protein
MLSRDEIFEGISLSLARDPNPSVDVPRLAFDTFFSSISLLVTNRVTVLVEAAFQHQRWHLGIEPLLSVADVRIVECKLATELARDRVVERCRREGRSAPDLGPESAVVRRFEPLHLAVPTLTVSTIDGYDPAMDKIMTFLLDA